jgi:hypothetical protein
MNNFRKYLLIFFLFIMGIKAFPQNNDAGLWLSANIEKNFNQYLGISFSEELRLMENISEASTIFSDIGFEYRYNKHLKASAHYRFLNDRRLDDSYASKNRFYFDISYRQKIKPFAFLLRERLQSQFVEFNSSQENNPELYSRTKATVKLDLKYKVSPYLSTELFNPINNPAARFVDKARYCAGFEYLFSPRQMLDLNYMIQKSYTDVPGNDFIIGMGYYLTL